MLILLCPLLLTMSLVGCEMQSNDKLPPRKTAVDNQDKKKDGLSKSYSANGQIKSECNYVNGLKSGVVKEWWENGSLSLVGNYKNGLANGLMKWYSEKGHLAA